LLAGDARDERWQFRRLGAGSLFLLVSAPLEAAARDLGLLEPGGLECLLNAGGGGRGRARTAVVPLPGRCQRLHLRPVRRGGLLGGLRGDLHFGLGRPVAELRANARLEAAGAAVPHPVLVAGRRRAGPLWAASVGTVHEEDTQDGIAFLTRRPGCARILRAATAAGEAVRRFHAAGGCHADLHVGNLLLRESRAGTSALLIDLDRARVVERVGARERMAELMRLYRSLVKRGLQEIVGRRACARFLAAYAARDRELRRELLSHLPREGLRLALHALRYPR
jgi:tRNA A-37 threonylcarbamoyl transferase component Bud32